MNIMLVEDHELFSAGLRYLLARLYRPTAFSEFKTASAALKHLHHNFGYDFIFLDLSLPDLDGAIFMQSLLDQNLMIPVIVVSASDDLEKIHGVINAGACGFIPKSHTQNEIEQAIKTVVAGNVYLPLTIKKRLTTFKRGNQHPATSTGKLGITARQMKVLQLLAHGLSNRQIANTLFLSENTIKSHTAALFQIFGVDNRLACVSKAKASHVLHDCN